MLNLAEELMLLALNDETGNFINNAFASFDYAIAGALLMDLALLERIDYDNQSMFVLDPSPTLDPLLDHVLKGMTEEHTQKSPVYWIKMIRNHTPELNELIMERLIQKGVLRKVENRFLWVFKTRRYPTIDDHEVVEAKTRLRSLILYEAIPEPQDIILVSLMHTCEMLSFLLTETEMEEHKDRIELISKMDLVCLAVNSAVQELHKEIMTAFLV